MSPPFTACQVVAAPKKKAKPGKEEEGSEPAEPETWAKKASSCLPLILKDASDARTASIKLGGMEYASELATQLLEHATKMEAFWTKLNTALAAGRSDRKLKEVLEELEGLNAFGIKAQAGAGIYL